MFIIFDGYLCDLNALGEIIEFVGINYYFQRFPNLRYILIEPKNIK